jgi:hypothetical protein
MNCSFAEQQMQELLDQRVRQLPELLNAHLRECARCRVLWKNLTDLESNIRVWRKAAPPTQLTDSILQALANQNTTTTLSRSTRGKPLLVSHVGSVCSSARASTLRCGALCLSVCVMIAVIGIGWRISGHASFARRTNLSRNTQAITHVIQPPATSSLAFSEDRQLDILIHDARNAYSALAMLAWQDAAQADLLIPKGDIAVPMNVDDAPSFQAVPETLTQPLVPLGRELRNVVDALWEQLSLNQGPST